MTNAETSSFIERRAKLKDCSRFYTNSTNQISQNDLKIVRKNVDERSEKIEKLHELKEQYFCNRSETKLMHE